MNGIEEDLRQWRPPQILAVKPQNIEGDEVLGRGDSNAVLG
jgi:hypothetical protein